MRKSRYSEEKIIRVLKQVESGQKVKDVIREHGISEQTYYRWKSKYGGMSVSEAKRLKALETENKRLKKLVADLSLDKQMLQEVIDLPTWRAGGSVVIVITGFPAVDTALRHPPTDDGTKGASGYHTKAAPGPDPRRARAPIPAPPSPAIVNRQ